MQNVIVSFTIAVVFVLLGSVATELRWGGHHNFTFTRHEFLVTVKEWLKLVYFYQSYRKNKSGVPLILDHPVYYRKISVCLFVRPSHAGILSKRLNVFNFFTSGSHTILVQHFQ